MLDENKKSLIEAEERYRHEIAKKIGDEVVQLSIKICNTTTKAV
jgi:hypothetical protein